MRIDWSHYDQYDDVLNKYMPGSGEGSTIASQAVTAVNKLVYKWYNDGDVFDNTFEMEGWCNDLSSYANWLYRYMPGCVRDTLMDIQGCETYDDYESLLAELSEYVFDWQLLSFLEKFEKNGSIYKCAGPFTFSEHDIEADEDYYTS